MALDLPELPDTVGDRIRACVPSFVAVRNPVDLTAQILSDHSQFAAVLSALADESAFDAVLIQLTTNADPGAEAIARAVIEAGPQVNLPLIVSRYGAASLAPRALARLRGGRPPHPGLPRTGRSGRGGSCQRRAANHSEPCQLAIDRTSGLASSQPSPGRSFRRRCAERTLIAVFDRAWHRRRRPGSSTRSIHAARNRAGIGCGRRRRSLDRTLPRTGERCCRADRR